MYLAANDMHPEQRRTQCQASAPRHDFLGGSSQELAAACAALAGLAAQRRGDVAECERLKQAERQAFADAMHRLDLTMARQTYPTFILSEIGRYSRKQHDKKNRKKHR
jgi:hypothetical protein